MKNQLFTRTLILFAIIVGLSAFIFPSFKGTKDYPTEKFSKVSIALNSKVYVVQGQEYKLDIQADDATLEKIKVEFEGDELSIECKHGSKIEQPVLITITAPSLNAISIAGSADLFIEKSYEAKEMDLSIAGGGSMNLNKLMVEKVSSSVAGSGKLIMNDLEALKVNCSVAGSGDVSINGQKAGESEDFSIAGSGNIDASAFETFESKVEIAGSGDCKVFVSKKLQVSIAGSGAVRYKGNPVIEKEVAGSGSVNPLE
jgi:hypothetical protein